MVSVSDHRCPIIERPKEGDDYGVLPERWRDPTQAPHPVPSSRREPLLRGADGGGGLLLRLVAAVPHRRTLGDRRLTDLGASRPADGTEPSADSAAPETARPVPGTGLEGAGRSDRTPPRAGQRRRADLVRVGRRVV